MDRIRSQVKSILRTNQQDKFDYKYSYESILDTLVVKNNRNSLSAKLYSKPTDRPTYTHVTSYHPKSQIQNIPYGQALRVKRICAEEEDFKAGWIIQAQKGFFNQEDTKNQYWKSISPK